MRRGFRIALIALPGVIALLGLSMLAFLWRPALLLGAHPDAVSYSLGAEARSGLNRSPHDCTPTRSDDLLCIVRLPIDSNDSTTTSVHYRVSIGRDGCWTAIRIRSAAPAQGPQRLADCLGIRDYYQPLEAPNRYD